MLSQDQAQYLAAEWRPRFSDPEAYTTSVERYLDRIAVPARSAEGLERWLREDLEQDDVRGALLRAAPGQNLPQVLPELVDDCASCRGKRLVRRDLPVGHAEFGKLIVCPACGGRPTGHVEIPPLVERNRCMQCVAFQDEWATEKCGNPKWHDPNWNTGMYPATTPVAGWTSVGEHV